MAAKQAWLVDNDGQLISQDTPRLDFNQAGVGLLSTKSVGLVLDTPASTDTITFELTGKEIFFFTINQSTNELIKSTSRTITFTYAQMTSVTQSGVNYRYCNVFIGWEPKEEYSTDPTVDTLLVSGFDSTGYIVPIYAESTGISDRHMVFINNLKRGISGEYLLATRSTDIEQQVQDPIQLNDKTREYLLNLFSLKDEIGSYDNLFKVLSFFEWDDFVAIKEYWQSKTDPNKWKQTDVTNEIADLFETGDLIGYQKTRFLGLFYQLNEWNGNHDDDGIPYYVKIGLNFKALMLKLNTLKTILQRDFLPDDVKIIDIVGEHTSFAGIDVNVFLNIATFFEQRLNTDLSKDYIDIDINTTGDDAIYLTEHKVLLDQNLYTVTGDDIVSNGNPTHFSQKIFEIYAADEELDTHNYQDFELLTNFYRADFGLLKFKVTLKKPIPDFFYGYKVLIEEKIINPDNTYAWNQEFLSELKPISHITNQERLGVKKLGVYRINFIFFDGYGAMSIHSSLMDFKVLESILQVKIYRCQYITDNDSVLTKIERTIQELDTYSYPNGTPVYDISDEPITPNVTLPYKFYADVSRLGNTATPMFREIDFNLIQTGKLNRVPVIEYSRYFELLVLDVLGDGRDEGDDIIFKSRIFETHDWDIVAASYGGGITGLGFVKYFCQLIRDFALINPNSAFANFTYNVYSVSIDGTAENKRPMIVMESVVNDYTLGNHWYQEGTNISIFGTNQIIPYGRVDAIVRIEPDRPLSTIFTEPDLMLRVYLTDQKVIDQVCVSYQNFYDILKAYEILHHRDIWVEKNDDDTSILVSSIKHKIRIEHPVIGIYEDVIRNAHLEKFIVGKIGDDFAIGSLVYADVDEEEKYENTNFHWKVYDSFTNQVIHEDFNKVMRTAIMQEGIFDIELEILDKSWSNAPIMKTRKKGALKVN